MQPDPHVDDIKLAMTRIETDQIEPSAQAGSAG
jgi:hypothetical protein